MLRPTEIWLGKVTLRRPLITAATKLFLPLLVILLVAFVALFVHAKELEVRASVGVTSLLAFDDAIARLVEREERALYPERREQIRDMLFTEFSKRLPLLPLFFLADRTVADPQLKGWNVGSGKNCGLTMERWYFESAPAPQSTSGDTAP